MPRWFEHVRSLNQPLHMLALSVAVRLFGSARARERFGLLTARPMYAYGLFRAADLAREDAARLASTVPDNDGDEEHTVDLFNNGPIV